ncbi:MAG: diguanylate cyclase [Bryobacteraceae bacterium]
MARGYWFCVLAAGASCFLLSMKNWSPHGSIVQLAAYLTAAIVASSVRIRLPGVPGKLSMNYAVIMAALLNIDLPSAMIVAVLSTLGQWMIQAVERPRWFDVVFSSVGVAVPVLTANFMLHLSPLPQLALVAASLAWFLIDTAMSAGLTGFTDGAELRASLRTSLQYLLGGCIAGAVHFMDQHLGGPALAISIVPLYLVYRSLGNHLGRLEEQQQHITEMAELHVRTIETLALAIDAEDDTAGAHLRRIQVYAREVGKELKLSHTEMKALEAAALLRDIGKLAVPEYITSKPGKLTPEEFEKMKVHPVVGSEILDRVRFPYPVAPIVRSHHEKYDGTGYPDGLAGGQIPIGARILSAVDCLDALASDRKYRKAMPLEQAMHYVAMESGKSYDPRVVAILQRRFREFEQQVRAETADYVKLSSQLKLERSAAHVPKRADAVTRTRDHFPLAISGARREFQMLIEAMNDLGSSLKLDETLAVLGVRLTTMVDHDAIAIYLIEDDKLVPHFVKGESFQLFSSLEIPLGQGLSGWVAESGLPIANGNPAAEAGYLNDPTKVTLLRSAISVPLGSTDGVVGVLTLYSLRARAFGTDDHRLLLAIAPKAGLAIQNALRFERAASAADTDQLTGLPNARFLFSQLQSEVDSAAQRNGSLAIAVIDLDGFKAANDQYGHLAGNRILHAVARSLRQNCRAGDLVARLGGDEFVILMREPERQAEETLARIDQAVRGLSFDPGCEASISFSAGVANYPEDGLDAGTLLEKADERMYEVKRGKKNWSARLSGTRLHVASPFR